MKFKNNNTLQLIGRHNFTHSLLTRIFSGISIFIICRLAYLYLLPHFFDISLIKEFRTDQIDTFLSRDFSNNPEFPLQLILLYIPLILAIVLSGSENLVGSFRKRKIGEKIVFVAISLIALIRLSYLNII